MSGFDVEKGVFSDGQPVGNVGFLLYVEKGTALMVKYSSDDVPLVDGIDPYTEANKVTGTYTFPGVTSGKNRIVPLFAENKAIKFHIRPEAHNVTVDRDGVRAVHHCRVSSCTSESASGIWHS